MPDAPETPPRGPRRALLFIFLAVFLDLLGAGILVPVIPFLVRPFSSDALTIGLLALSFSAAQFFAAPVLGALSDRFGRRPVLVLSVLGSSAGYFMFGIGGALWVLFAARILDGITGGNITAAQAYIADVTAPEDRAKGFGLIGAAFGVGFIFGPAIGGALSRVSLQAPAYAAGILALGTAAFGFFVLPESLPPERRRPHPLHVGDFDPFRLIVAAMKRPAERGLFIALIASRFAMAGLHSNFGVFTLDKFHFGPADNAMIFVFLGVVVAGVQGGLMRPLSSRVADRPLSLGGFALMAAGFAFTAAAPAGWMLYPAIAVMAIGSGLATPTLQGLMSKAGGAGAQGTIFGAAQAVTSLTQIAAPAFAGAVFDHVGMSAPYWFGTGFVLVALWAVFTSVRE